MYITENTMSADLKVLRQNYTTGARINYIPSSIHSSVTFKILTAVTDKWVQLSSYGMQEKDILHI